ERRDAGSLRSADLPACAATGAAPGEEPVARRDAGVPLPDAGPGGDAWALQGHRGRARPAPARLSRPVRDADIPPVPAPAAVSEAARRRRLDDIAVLPPGHRRAGDARTSRAPRVTEPAQTPRFALR